MTELKPSSSIENYQYRLLKLDLTNGLSDFEVEYEGEKIIYIDGTEKINIKLWSPSNDNIEFTSKRVIIAPFKRFYISAPAVSKIVSLLLVKPADFTLDIKEVTVDNINHVNDIDEIDTVDTITEVSNVSSVDLVDNVSHIDLIQQCNILGRDQTKTYHVGVSHSFTHGHKTSGVSGEYAYEGITNPSGSGKKIYITSFKVQVSDGNPRNFSLWIQKPARNSPSFFTTDFYEYNDNIQFSNTLSKAKMITGTAGSLYAGNIRKARFVSWYSQIVECIPNFQTWRIPEDVNVYVTSDAGVGIMAQIHWLEL